MSQNAGFAGILTRALLLLAAAACSLLNGFSGSPLHDGVDYTLGIAVRGYPFMTRALLYNYITPLAIALMTMALSGIPAALYERLRGLKASSPVSLAIWLTCAVLLSLPVLMRLAAGDELN